MKKLLRLASLVAACLLVAAGPVTAAGAWVDRIENVDTVLAVRFEDDFPRASLMRATCPEVYFVQRPDGSGTEILRCQLSNEPVMIPEFQGQPPTRVFTHRVGPCEWTSDYWFARNGSIVLASSAHYVVLPNGTVIGIAH